MPLSVRTESVVLTVGVVWCPVEFGLRVGAFIGEMHLEVEEGVEEETKEEEEDEEEEDEEEEEEEE